MTPHELLHAHGIELKNPKLGEHSTTCPQCSAKRSNAHQKTKCLSVKIEANNRVCWFCHHCGWSGPPKDTGPRKGEIKPTYIYRDSDGVIRFGKVRNPPGSAIKCWFCHPNGNGTWEKGAGGADLTLVYRADEVAEAIKAGREICIVEGEKDADNLWRINIPATCNAGGASEPEKKPKWTKAQSAQLNGTAVVVFNDNDPPGYAHADTICKLSVGVAKRVQRLDLKVHWPEIPKGGDVSDWLAVGGQHTPGRLRELIAAAPEHQLAVAEDTGTGGYEDSVALEFVAQYGEDYRYIAKSVRWMHWNGTRWSEESTLLAYDTARALCRLGGDADAKVVSAVERLARADRRIAATIEQWDRDPDLLCTPGGTIELRTGEMRPSARGDYCTKQTAVAPAPVGSTCDLWGTFLDDITNKDDDLIAFLQRLCGYCLTGHISENIFAFLYGTGANGKGTFLKTIGSILGDYHTGSPIEMFLLSKFDRHPTELARLHNVRLTIAQETPKGRTWDEAKIKNMTGGDVITGRYMRADFFDFMPNFKLLVAGNYKPYLRNVDEAIRRRLLLLPFIVTIPKAKRDRQLADKLKAEWPTILRWMIDGAIAWYQDGLLVPATVSAATDEYLADQDGLEQWVADSIKVDPQAFTTSRELFKSWQKWCAERDLAAGSEKAFVEMLEGKGYKQDRRKYGRGFKGISLIASDQTQTEANLG